MEVDISRKYNIQPWYLLRIGVVLLRMVRFVEYQKIDLVNGDESVHETLIQNFSRAHNDHIFGKMLLPDASMPEITAHISTEAFDLLVEIVLQDGELLENKSHAVNL